MKSFLVRILHCHAGYFKGAVGIISLSQEKKISSSCLRGLTISIYGPVSCAKSISFILRLTSGARPGRCTRSPVKAVLAGVSKYGGLLELTIRGGTHFLLTSDIRVCNRNARGPVSRRCYKCVSYGRTETNCGRTGHAYRTLARSCHRQFKVSTIVMELTEIFNPSGGGSAGTVDRFVSGTILNSRVIVGDCNRRQCSCICVTSTMDTLVGILLSKVGNRTCGVSSSSSKEALQKCTRCLTVLSGRGMGFRVRGGSTISGTAFTVVSAGGLGTLN